MMTDSFSDGMKTAFSPLSGDFEKLTWVMGYLSGIGIIVLTSFLAVILVVGLYFTIQDWRAK